MHPVHGLVLHQLSLQQRPLLYRAALSEMIVPYGDNDNMHAWKHVLDASEYNMGMLVNSLKLGCDCLGEIFYFDVHQVTWEGKVKSVENAICMKRTTVSNGSTTTASLKPVKYDARAVWSLALFLPSATMITDFIGTSIWTVRSKWRSSSRA
jgi:hypothetical protein